ncbi:MAG TPA: PAS domain S-box protein, partial [Anaerolineae bacterium]|nr:PAS domain S-box protein [Anaerolineae bacterium]
NVTERRLAEEALRASEEKYRNLTNQLPVGIYRDMPPGKLIYANPALAAILGYASVEEALQTSIRDVFDDPGKRDAHLANCRLNGEVAYNEMKVRTAEGAHIWVRDTARVFLNEAGEIDYIDGIIQDITDRKEAEEALRASEIRFRSLIQNSSDIITLLAADGTIQYVSPPVQRILGFQPEEIIGRSTLDYVHPEDLLRVQDQLSKIVQHPGIDDTPTEFRVRDAQGEWRWLEAINNNLLNDPNVNGIVVNGRDISRRREIEEQFHLLEAQFLQAQKMEAIGRLAGGVAHDFNNALTIIKGYSDLLLVRLKEPGELRLYAEQIKKASNQAASVTRQLLIFSRQEMAQPETIDLNAVMVDIEKMLERLIGEDIDLVIMLEPALGLVKANPGHVEQVIMNLVINARDAMPQGGRLTIQTVNATVHETTPTQPMPLQPGRYVQLAVTDTGIGMNQETLSHIFEPFYTTKEQGKGTGLGLSTVYAIVTQSRGSIQVFSQPGQGTVFQIYLPYLTDQIEADAGLEDSEALEAVPGKQVETILLVEDEAEVRKLTKLILLKQGYRVLEAQNGDEALRLCQQSGEPVHLILTDVVMPNGMSGRELAEQLKIIIPKAKVLFMSGYTDDVILRHGVLDASVNFIQKPFALNIL